MIESWLFGCWLFISGYLCEERFRESNKGKSKAFQSMA